MTKKLVSISVDEDVWDALRLVTAARGAKMSSYINALLRGVTKYEIESLLAESKNTIEISRNAWSEGDVKAANQLSRLLGRPERFKLGER